MRCSVSICRFLSVILTVCLSGTFAPTLRGADATPVKLTWAEKMLSERKFDFGTVSRGADVSHSIRITNIYKEKMSVADVSVTSPDFEASVDKDQIASREVSTLTIRPKTSEISDTSAATVSVKLTFDGENFQQVQIPVSVHVNGKEIAAAATVTEPTRVMRPGLNWAQQMFSELDCNFGNVARGAEAKYVVEVTNLYKEDVTLSGPIASCACITPVLERSFLKSKESTKLVLDLNTVRFEGKRDVTVTLTATFDGLNHKEIRIPIQAYIRKDVVLEPGSVHFGTAAPGETAERRVRVLYAGRSNWKIQSVRSNSPHLTPEFREVSRFGQNVEYELLVKLNGTAPKGTLREQIVLETDDSANPKIPVLVDASIEADMRVIPEELKFGTVKAGTPKITQFVVQGNKPFRIEKVECDSDRDWFSVALIPADKTNHIVKITMTAPDQPGPFKENMSVTIAGRKTPVSFTVSGTIEGTAPAATPESTTTTPPTESGNTTPAGTPAAESSGTESPETTTPETVP